MREKKLYRFCQASVFTHIHLFLIINKLVCATVRIISLLGTSFSYAMPNYNESSCLEMKKAKQACVHFSCTFLIFSLS